MRKQRAAITSGLCSSSSSCGTGLQSWPGGLLRAASSASSSTWASPSVSAVPVSGGGQQQEEKGEEGKQQKEQQEQQERKAARLAVLLLSDPALCVGVAASVDSRTAARFALTFSRAAGLAGTSEKVKAADGGETTAATARVVERPSRSQMRQLFVRTSIPFVGFGFFDNVIMLTVGETLDCTLGVAFGFSTLAAAGMGQMVSDASGITLQGLIERSADRLGLPDPRLNHRQQQLDFVKYSMIASRIIGIMLGCCLGMFPLVVMPERHPRLVDQIAEKLSPQHRAEFQSLVTTERFSCGDKLLAHGGLSEKVFMIQSGQLEVIGRDLEGSRFTVCTMGPGHAFGIPALARPSRVDLVAKDQDVVVQTIGKSDFLRITEDEEAINVYMDARIAEIDVHQRTLGDNFGLLRAVKGTGKTKKFAALSQEAKLQVLAFTGREQEVKCFQGKPGEGKVGFFAHLPEETKRDALVRWFEQDQERKRRQEEAAATDRQEQEEDALAALST